MKKAVVLYTLECSGHLMPMVALAKTFINHGFSANIVTFNHPLAPGNADREISRVSSANPTINFHVLSPVTLRDGYENLTPPAMTRAVMSAQKLNFYNFLQDLSGRISVRAIVLDLFLAVAPDFVNYKLSIPVHVFSACGASSTAFFFHVLELEKSTNLSLKDFGENPINFAGIPPVIVSDCPPMLLDRETELYKSFMETMFDVPKLDGIFINTFEALESKAISALREGICAPSFNVPPIYCIGPLVAETRGDETVLDDRHECLKWLDSQPKNTVVFLCFGSMCCMSPDQNRQIAIGLENSGQRFLWALKLVQEYPKKTFELNEMLPEGFLDRTKDKGIIVKNWAPQVEVLNHESVGGFMTHCGWNSVLEAVRSGKPMVCWPLDSEQRLNKAVLVEMGLGVAVEGYEKDIVEAGEVEGKVRWLTEDDDSKWLKERTKVMKNMATEAWRETGSSSKAFREFLMDLERQKLEKTKVN